jgi:hypothetical protein
MQNNYSKEGKQVEDECVIDRTYSTDPASNSDCSFLDGRIDLLDDDDDDDDDDGNSDDEDYNPESDSILLDHTRDNNKCFNANNNDKQDKWNGIVVIDLTHSTDGVEMLE